MFLIVNSMDLITYSHIKWSWNETFAVSLGSPDAMSQHGLRAEDGRAIVVIVAVIGVVFIASVALRIVSRRMRDLSLGLDDYLTMSAMVS